MANRCRHLPSPRWLSPSDIELLNQLLIDWQTPNEPVGVLNPSGLSSAQQRAAQYQYYAQVRDVFKLASVFAEALVQNHPFYNANKRTAAASVTVFLLINGWELSAPPHELVDIFEGMARHFYSAEDLEHWLAHNCEEFDASCLSARASADFDKPELSPYNITPRQ